MAVEDPQPQHAPSASDLASPPNVVNFLAFSPIKSPCPRRLSSHCLKPNRPVQFKLHFRPRSAPAKAQLAWVSLQGRLVGAEEASSARTIGGGLGRDEVLAWELFSPIHRILIVAVVAVAAARSEKNRQIHQLRERVRVRVSNESNQLVIIVSLACKLDSKGKIQVPTFFLQDEMLLSMQQKLDNLREEVKDAKGRLETLADSSISKADDVPSFVCADCWLCEQHRAQSNGFLANSTPKLDCGDQILKYPVPVLTGAEQEERRLSDLSDLASTSAASAVDILVTAYRSNSKPSIQSIDMISLWFLQLNNLAIEQDIYNAKREAEEKDAAVKELSAYILSKDKTTSKRIEELEDIIRRKSAIITKQKKDIAVLGKKVVQLTRVKRPLFSGSSSENEQLPMMVDNLLFGMESTTSSSSDSDRSPEKRKMTSSIGEESVTSQGTSNESSLTMEPSSSGKRKKASSIDTEELDTSQENSSIAIAPSCNRRQMPARPTSLNSIGRPPSQQNQRSQSSLTVVNPLMEKSTIMKPSLASSRTKQQSVTVEKSTTKNPNTVSSRPKQALAGGETKNGRRVDCRTHFNERDRLNGSLGDEGLLFCKQIVEPFYIKLHRGDGRENCCLYANSWCSHWHLSFPGAARASSKVMGSLRLDEDPAGKASGAWET
ncbi:hypothetical protein Dimus_021410 [Dionaea muscipula]